MIENSAERFIVQQRGWLILRRLEDFDNEYLFVIPHDALQTYIFSPIIMNLYVTDLGFFPNTESHYVDREKGAEGWVLIFCTNGSGAVEVNGKTYAMHQHSLVIMPPDVPHKYYATADDPWDIYWVHFRGKLAEEYMSVFPDTAYFVDELPMSQVKPLMEQFWLMIKAFIPGFTYNRVLYVSQLLGAILASLSVNNTGNRDVATGSNYVDSAIQYIYRHVNEPIKLQDVADTLGISTSYLSRTFRAAVHTSVNQFITNTKMERASHYLQYTNIPIQQIATRLGYTDSYYFSRVFKKTFKVSPKSYRSSEL